MQKRHRVFIAINLPEDIKRALEKRQKSIQSMFADLGNGQFGEIMKWTGKDNLHITLEFLGDLTDVEIADVCKIAGEVAKRHRSFSINLNKICYDSAASLARRRMPLGMFNLIEGGRHVPPQRDPASGGTKNHPEIQEFMVVPEKETFTENLVLCNKIFQNLQDILTKSYGPNVLMGDEGGFAPEISKTEQALFLLKNAIAGGDAKIAIDCAASEFYSNGKYNLDGRELSRSELFDFYADLADRFPIISIEDPFAEEDWNGFEFIARQLGQKVLIIGDDLTTTNIKRIKEARNKLACNGVILKLNQIGTVSETIEASKLAKSFGWKTIVSHRSGETMDDFIADLAVGTEADFIKSGSPAKLERMVKYKRLLDIENELQKIK